MPPRREGMRTNRRVSKGERRYLLRHHTRRCGKAADRRRRGALPGYTLTHPVDWRHETRGQTGRFRFRAIVVLFARGSIRTRHRSGRPHHVNHRGNMRQFILATDAERLVYLDLRNGVARRMAGYATLGAAPDNRGLAEPSRGGYLASRGRCHSREHPYRTAARHIGIFPRAGTRLRPPARCSERRSRRPVGAQSCQRLAAINA